MAYRNDPKSANVGTGNAISSKWFSYVMMGDIGRLPQGALRHTKGSLMLITG